VHFVCDQCDKTECLEQVIVPEVKLPAGYTISRIEMVINGVCKDCR
jgi:Fur family transcriptional regulator, ferric uptake regulator